jgi:hypothetical protein
MKSVRVLLLLSLVAGLALVAALVQVRSARAEVCAPAVGSIPLPPGGHYLALSQTKLFIAGSGSVTMLDRSTLAPTSAPTAIGSPGGMAANPVTNQVSS